jgi:hypothetical protein
MPLRGVERDNGPSFGDQGTRTKEGKGSVEKIGRVISAVIVSVALGYLCGYFMGKVVGRKEMVVEAVKANHGHYKIVDETGGTQFEWGPGPAIPK